MTYLLLKIVSTISIVLILQAASCDGAQIPQNDPEGELSGATLALVSVGLAGAGILFVAICTFTWFQRQFSKLCPDNKSPPEDPVFVWEARSRTSDASFNSFVTLNSSNLPTDHNRIVPTFELLPSPDTLVRKSVIILEDDDKDISAHDWFENQDLAFPRRNVHFIQEVGSGWFGLVIEADAKPLSPVAGAEVPAPKTRVWVKHLRDDASTREQMKFLDEARLYRDCSHKNVLKLVGFSIETFPYLLIFNQYPKGDLKTYLLERSKGLTLLDRHGAQVRSKMTMDIAQALRYIHDKGFTHPDLAARNCLVGANEEIIIGDYGLGPEKYDKDYHWVMGVPIPIRWAAPESLKCTPTALRVLKATKEANVWSYGVLLWEICELGKLPYSDLTDEQVLQRVVTDKNHNLAMPSITSLPYVTLRNKMFNIITSCFHPLPGQRIALPNLIDSLSAPL